jgi:sugar phosphate isomerase/epimerase
MSHHDIRLGTVVPLNKGNTASFVRQVLPHGFESFQMFIWEKIGELDLDRIAGEVRDAIGDRATISSIGMFGNPLQSEQAAKDWGRCIDACERFGCHIVAGFAGAINGRPFAESIPVFKRVWSELARRAEDKGVRLAWENCDMGGEWNRANWNIAHASTAWEILFNEVASPAVGLEWEPCHQMVSLVDPIPQLRKWIGSGKIFHLHGKDATIAWDVIRSVGIRAGKPYVWHRTPGFGDTNWTDVISILRQHKWTGAIDIEGYHDPVYVGELEMTGQVHGLNYLKHCRGGPFVPNPK